MRFLTEYVILWPDFEAEETAMARIWRFVKKEAVLCIAAMCAVLTMFLVPPDGGYPGYIDLRVLCLLLCLMAVVAGFRSCGAFQWLACQLLSWGGRGRGLAVTLVLLPFFSAMLVTNDVALLTFVPFTMLLLETLDCREAAIPLLVLQTIAANLGSMATPVGNPQNLFLYAAYSLSAGAFFSVMLPLTAISLVCLAAASLPVLPKELAVPELAPAVIRCIPADKVPLVLQIFRSPCNGSLVSMQKLRQCSLCAAGMMAQGMDQVDLRRSHILVPQLT